MGLFDRLRSRVTDLVPIVGSPLEDAGRVDLAEAGGRLNELANRSDEKNLAYQDYAAWQNLDENGSFFGPEFSIRATAPRIKALFVNEPWVYVTATLIAKTLAGIPLKIYRVGPDGQPTDQEVPNHPLAKMINGGSIYQSGKHQLWSGYLDLVLGGNFFLVVDQFFLSLTLAPVELVSINLGDVSNPGPTSITVANPSKMGTRYLVPYNRVVHLRLPNPNNPFYGLSPFAAASRPMLLDRYKNEFEMAFYLRGATNNGVIETTQDISKQRFERLMRSFEQTYTGKRNWWRTLFLPKGATWKSASPTMKDMEHLDGLKENRKTILSVLGIPPSMVGLTEDVNYSTSEAQMQIFYDTTIIPMITFIEDGFNNSQLIKTVFRGQVAVRADLSKVRAMRDQGELAVKGDIAGKIARFFTINEIRDMVFQAPPAAAGGDVFAIQPGSGNSGFGNKEGGGGGIGSSTSGTLGAAALPNAIQAAIDGPQSVQLVMCSKDKFRTREDAAAWVHNAGFRTDTFEESDMEYRYQQRAQQDFDQNTLHATNLDDGVSAIVGELKENPGDNGGGSLITASQVDPAFLIMMIVFEKTQYKTAQDAITWARAHGYKTDTLMPTETTWQLVQHDVNDFVQNSFYAVELPDSVKAVFGKLKNEEGSQASSGGEPSGVPGATPADLPYKFTQSAEVKEAHHLNIMAVERSYGQAFLGVYNRYLDNVFTLLQRAVASRQDILQHLKGFEPELQAAYLIEAMDVLQRAQQRGYALGRVNTKGLNAHTVTKAADYRFTDVDSQAIDVLAARGKRHRDDALKTAVVDRFKGFNSTRTEQIMGLVEEGYNQGKTLEDIAATIREDYGERYPDQAYTIARTEVLSALSSGVKAHNEDLQSVFSDVNKEWVSVGDEHVRDEHQDFEGMGAVSADYEYAPGLTVPRDYGADPGQVINCRCSLVNSIPSSATSRASAILEGDTPQKE